MSDATETSKYTAFDPLDVPLGGRHLVEASAGTGKTFTLALLYVRLVIERRLSVRSILVVTFTRAATAELKERIRARLRQMFVALSGQDDPSSRDPLLARLVAERTEYGDVEGDCDRLAQALASFDEAAISTIHGFCQRALEEHSFGTRTDPDMEFVKDDSQLLAEIAADYHATHLEQASPRVYADLSARAREPVPTYLARLVRAFTQHHGLTLLPTSAPPLDVPGLEAALEAAHESACESYPGGDVLVNLLLGAALNGTKYRKKTVQEKWRLRLDAYFAAPAPLRADEELSKILLKLTPEMLAAGTKKGGAPPVHPHFADVAHLCAAWGELQAALSAETTQSLLRFADYARHEVPVRKARAQRRSFSDLLVALYEALEAPDAEPLIAALRTAFSAALVDEFQDTDPIQYAIFERLFGDETHPLFLIGDPKQAIYGFRGADIYAYLRAADDERAQHHTLTTNWRSDPGLISAAATLFDVPVPFVDPRIEFIDVEPRPGVEAKLSGAALRFLWLGMSDAGTEKTITVDFLEHQMPTLLATHVARLLRDEESLDPPDIAVLTRSNRAARAVQGALLAAGVPAVLESDASVFDSREASDIEMLLRALLTPMDGGAVRAALATPLFGYAGRELLALARDESAWDAVVSRFAQSRAVWFERGPAALIRHLFDDFDMAARLLVREGGERSLMNVLHVFELLADIATRERVTALSLVDRFHRLRVDGSARSEELSSSAELRLETDASAVRVTTIHKSKGLEYPVVYLPYACELGVPRDRHAASAGVYFHDPDAEFRYTLDLGSERWEEHRELSREEAFAEGMRLFYVALTRAKHRVYMVWGPVSGAARSSTGYLLHGGSRVTAGQGPRAAMAKHVEPLGEKQLRKDLEAFAKSPHISVEDLVSARSSSRNTEPPVSAEAVPVLTPRGALPSVRVGYRVASFSSLKSSSLPEDLLDGRDRDQGLADTFVSLPIDESPVTLAEFPAGTGPGHVVHEVFERYAFSAPESTPLEALCADVLGRRGFDVKLADMLARGLKEVLDTPLGGAGEPRLHDIEAHRAELEFFLSARSSPGLDPARLAEVFRKHAAPSGSPNYAERLARLTFPALRGYLHGFIDLIFRAGGRYYVVDYKTNHLGGLAQDYRPQALLEPMAHHHYHLQYHLYVVATVRMLRQRVPDFDYDAHFGGVRYLFVRGMAPEHEPGTGVYVDRPTRACVSDLERVLMGTQTRAGT